VKAPRLLRRLALVIIAIVVSTTSGPSAASAGTGAPTLTSSTVQSGLTIPWDLGFTPDGRMLVTIRSGQVRIYASGNANAPLVRTVSIASVYAQGEAGVMGIAVDPAFTQSKYFFVCVSRLLGGQRLNQVLRYRLLPDNTVVFSKYIVSSGMVANTLHNGCALEVIGGKLMVTMGDAGNAPLAQNRNSLNGKVLRINLDGTVPSDNPLIAGKRDFVFTMGHRNPQGIAVLPGAGRIYAVEHGPDRDDEINRLVPGKNYGWPCYTGAGRPYRTSGCAAASAYMNPAWSSGTSTIATSGATFMTGAAWGSWSGDLFVSQLKERDLRRFDETAIGKMAQASILVNNAFGRIRAAVRGPYGRLYITTSNGGGSDRVIWIAPRG
jgi:glucose/arabinose dehydrogenase